MSIRRPDARTFGQDLMRGEHIVGKKRKPDAKNLNDGTVVGKGGLATQMASALAANRETASGSGLAIGITSAAYRKAGEEATAASSGTSIFDPVLCELAYRWFSAPGGVIIDPFAGGSVRGIVASKLGRPYIGVDLSERQVTANKQQAANICRDPLPTWRVGDSRNIAIIADGASADMVFSCPPYGDLERYSDDPLDLSTMPYESFLEAYREVITSACALLKPDRFAAFVVGDIRDKKGHYRDFPGDTVKAFRDAGLALYNEAILVTAAGSLPLRVGKQFVATRKLGRTHQSMLVFIKGDARRATQACGEVEFGEILTDDGEFGELL